MRWHKRMTVSLAVVAIPVGFAQRASSPVRLVTIGGELRQWHKVTLTLDGPQAEETGSDPNPFLDYRMTVTFAHESGVPTYTFPATSPPTGTPPTRPRRAGNKWRAHLAPDKTGRWDWRISFVRGKDVAVERRCRRRPAGAPLDGLKGSFQVAPTDKNAPDFRARGRLHYVGGITCGLPERASTS